MMKNKREHKNDNNDTHYTKNNIFQHF